MCHGARQDCNDWIAHGSRYHFDSEVNIVEKIGRAIDDHRSVDIGLIAFLAVCIEHECR